MRYYLIDELYLDQLQRIEKALDDRDLRGGIDGIWYLPVPEKMLSDEQRAHLGECGPYMLTLESGRVPEDDQGWLKMELLVRARNKLRCSCLAYASSELRMHMIDYLDGLIRELDISV